MRRAFGVSSSPLVSLAAGLNLNEPSSKVESVRGRWMMNFADKHALNSGTCEETKILEAFTPFLNSS